MKKKIGFYYKDGKVYDESGCEQVFNSISRYSNDLVKLCNKLDSLDDSSEDKYIFSEEKAMEYFKLLQSNDYNLIKLSVSWNNVEHESSGIYDEDFLANLRSVLKIAETFNIYILLVPEINFYSWQITDKGLPNWAFKTQDFNLLDFFNNNQVDSNVKTLDDNQYLEKTMFTLFFTGKELADNLTIDGDNIQDFLQSHYIAAIKHTARRLKDCRSILGIEIIKYLNSSFDNANEICKLKKMVNINGKNILEYIPSFQNAEISKIKDLYSKNIIIFKNQLIDEIKEKHPEYLFIEQ